MEMLTTDHGYMSELKSEIDRLEDTIYDLIKLRNKDTNPSEIIRINQAIANISRMRFELITKTSLAESFKKFVKEKIAAKKNDSSNNIYGMPVVTLDLVKYYDKQEKRKDKERKKYSESKGKEHTSVENN